MNHTDNFTFRMSSTDRQLIAAVAQQLERTESDAMRFLLRKQARELGVSAQQHERASVARQSSPSADALRA